MQLEVGLADAHRQTLHRSALSRVGVAIRQVVKGRDVGDVGGVEWLRREHRLVVLVRHVKYGV
jgi:hypothetical protein